MLMPAASCFAALASASKLCDGLRGIGSGDPILFRQSIEPRRNFRPKVGARRAGSEAHRPDVMAPLASVRSDGAVCRARRRSLTASSPSSRRNESGGWRQRFHPRQIAIHGFGPGLQLASQARHPIGPIFTGGIRPSPDSLAIAARDCSASRSRPISSWPSPCRATAAAARAAAPQPTDRGHRLRGESTGCRPSL